MTPTFTLGRVAGVEVSINWSWLVVVALMGWSLGAAVFPESTPGLSSATYAGMAAVAVPAFFGCLLLHELGHALQARREQMTIEGITLWLFGGVARFRGTFPSAGAEFRIAVAGPLVTLGLAALFVAAGVAVPLPAALDGVVSWLASVNVMLLAFNLLPALPLDGGRMLRAALWQFKDDFAAATRVAAALGRAFGQILVGGGVVLALVTGYFGGFWLAMIGWFLLLAAQAEAEAAIAHVALGGLRVRDAMMATPVTVDADLPLSDFIGGVFPATRHTAYPVVERGAPAGLITYRDAVAPRLRPGFVVRDRMTPLAEVLVVHRDDPLEAAWSELLGTPPGRALVLDAGRPPGLLSATDVQQILDAQQRGTPRRPLRRVAA